MLEPKRTKHRKQFRGKMRGNSRSATFVNLGDYALQARTRAWVNNRQLEAARRAIVKEMKRKGKIWIRVFPDHSFTKKPAEVRMGKGKGEVEGYVAVVRPGRIIFELGGVTEEVAKIALTKAAMKLPLMTKIISKTAILS